MVKLSIGTKGIKVSNGSSPIPGVNVPGGDLPNNFKPPPSGLVPTAIPGLYRDPSGPVDPRDCARWPDSPWCGGNPFNVSKPLGLDISPSVDACGVSLKANLTFLYVKMPPINITYRLPGECRNQYKAGSDPPLPPNPPATGIQPPKPTNGGDLSGLSKCLIGQSVIVLTASYQQWDYGRKDLTQPYQYSTSNTHAKLVNTIDEYTVQHDYGQTNVVKSKMAKISLFQFTSLNGTVDEDQFVEGNQFNANGDFTYSVDGWRNDNNWKKADNYPQIENQVVIAQEGGAPHIGLWRFSCKDAQKFVEYWNGRYRSTNYNEDDLTSQYTYSEIYARVIGVLFGLSPYMPPPPPLKIGKKDCCMSCCQNSPNQQNSNDALLRQILQTVSDIKNHQGVYPTSFNNPIDDTSVAIPNEVSFWKWLINNSSVASLQKEVHATYKTVGADQYPIKIIPNIIESVKSKIDTLNSDNPILNSVLQHLLSDFSQLLGVDGGTTLNNQLDLLDWQVNQLISYLAYFFDQSDGGKLGTFPLKTTITDSDITTPGRQGQEKNLGTVSEALSLVLDRIDMITTVLGFEEYPCKVPEYLLVQDGVNNEQIDIHSLTKLQEWYFKNFDALIGRFQIDVEIEENKIGDDGKPVTDDQGNPQTETHTAHYPNVAETLAEMIGLMYHVSMTVDSLQNIGLRGMTEAGGAKQQAFVNHMYLDAIRDYLGFGIKDKSEKMALAFKPGQTDLNHLLIEQEIDVKGIEHDGKGRLRDDLHDIKQGAQIIRAVYFRKLDHNGNITTQLIDLIKNAAQNAKDIADPKDPTTKKTNFDKFLEDVEIGFTDRTNIDNTTQPYGRPYDERPLIRKLGDANHVDSGNSDGSSGNISPSGGQTTGGT